jgi:hypothetical protein
VGSSPIVSTRWLVRRVRIVQCLLGYTDSTSYLVPAVQESLARTPISFNDIQEGQFDHSFNLPLGGGHQLCVSVVSEGNECRPSCLVHEVNISI